jgi:hypothetical protein
MEELHEAVQAYIRLDVDGNPFYDQKLDLVTTKARGKQKVQEVVLKPHQLLPVAKLAALCQEEEGQESQLLMQVCVETTDGAQHLLMALVDTGAQTSCIRGGALPAHYFAEARNP